MKTYTPAEVCEIFEITKTTLFRWETEGRISPVDRKSNGQRIYTQEHIIEIGQIKLAALERDFDIATKNNNVLWQEKIDLAILEVKALYLDDEKGLEKLRDYPQTLPQDTTRKLLLKASEMDPDTDEFINILDLVRNKAISSSSST